MRHSKLEYIDVIAIRIPLNGSGNNCGHARKTAFPFFEVNLSAVPHGTRPLFHVIALTFWVVALLVD